MHPVNISDPAGIGKCQTTIDGIPTEKSVGDTWNGEEPCVKYLCEAGPNNTFHERMIREYCFVKCNNVSPLLTAQFVLCFVVRDEF